MNKTRKFVVALASVFCLVLLGGSASGQGYSQEFSGAKVGAVYQPVGRFDTLEASRMIGYEVTDPQGGTLGQISSLVIDNTNGRVALLVLSDVPNLGGKELAIPYSSLMRTGENTFEFNPGDMALQVPGRLYTTPYVHTATWAPGASSLYGMPSKIDLEWVSYLYRHYGQEPYWTQEREQPPRELEFYESTQLMGAEVQTPKGEEVAQVNDLIIDSSDGRIAFVVLSNIEGREDNLVAAPFGALFRAPSRSGESVFVLNTTRERLASGPSFREFADLNNRQKAGDIYRFFGVQPYWTEEGMSGPIMKYPEPAVQPRSKEGEEAGSTMENPMQSD